MASKSLPYIGGVCLLTLATCGGGGGSSSSPPPPDPAAASFSLNAGVGANGIDASGAGSTVTIATDSNDRISSLTVNVTTAGVNFSQMYSGSTMQQLSAPWTLGQFAGSVQQVANAAPGSNGIVFQGSNQSLSFTYHRNQFQVGFTKEF
jgi:hypothetical protein